MSKEGVFVFEEEVVPRLKNDSISGVVAKLLFALNLKPIIDWFKKSRWSFVLIKSVKNLRFKLLVILEY